MEDLWAAAAHQSTPTQSFEWRSVELLDASVEHYDLYEVTRSHLEMEQKTESVSF